MIIRRIERGNETYLRRRKLTSPLKIEGFRLGERAAVLFCGRGRGFAAGGATKKMMMSLSHSPLKSNGTDNGNEDRQKGRAA